MRFVYATAATLFDLGLFLLWWRAYLCPGMYSEEEKLCDAEQVSGRCLLSVEALTGAIGLWALGAAICAYGGYRREGERRRRGF